ncbi:ATP-binding protein [Pseudomonas sp. UBA2684]|uniref:ATP-binding protein n=1 Tax=Pseudomonas sp. UBA2684 TaxID=1947311 RepID=UPI0025E26C9C|nr:ATP-binding protein [Pseudomonas sp. UBA2684]|tara:strand:- start:6333 stop:7709 length:1377 start_codon:yes stop_codon:yes gene_type:complete
MSTRATLRRRARGLSLRLRLMLGAGGLAVLFMLALLPALRGAFVIALEQVIEKRLAADAAALVSAVRTDNGRLALPDKLPNEEFDSLDAKLLGFIYDRDGTLIWQSRSALDEQVSYLPRYDGSGHEFLRIADARGQAFFVYDVEVDLLRGKSAAFSIVTMQPTRDYEAMYNGFMRQLYLWLGGALLVLLGLLWFGLTWGFRSLRGLSAELDEVETGSRASLSEHHPRELLRLTGSLNRLLDSERQQRERYRHSLDDLAHSLKTPLAVLQSVGEVIATQPQNREQSQVLQQQVERMSQQIGYQLQRASLRKSGLIRHSVRLAPLLDTLCDALDKVYRDKQVQVLRDFATEQQLPMEQGALLELLGNLLENAYRLCLGQVRVSIRQQGRMLELCVEDDGPGVPADQRERILRRGERLDAQHPGQGIGTAVVKDIIESYGGELLLEDSELGGASFRVRLHD